VEQGTLFDEEETLLLLQNHPVSQFPASLVEKLKKDEVINMLELMPRNLAALLPPYSHN